MLALRANLHQRALETRADLHLGVVQHHSSSSSEIVIRRDGDVSNATERPSVRDILIRKRPARTISSSPSWKPSSSALTFSCCSLYLAVTALRLLLRFSRSSSAAMRSPS